MTEPATLPPLPGHPEPHRYVWTKLELEAMMGYGHRCFQAGRKQAVEKCIATVEQYKVGINLRDMSDELKELL